MKKQIIATTEDYKLGLSRYLESKLNVDWRFIFEKIKQFEKYNEGNNYHTF